MLFELGLEGQVGPSAGWEMGSERRKAFQERKPWGWKFQSTKVHGVSWVTEVQAGAGRRWLEEEVGEVRTEARLWKPSMLDAFGIHVLSKQRPWEASHALKINVSGLWDRYSVSCWWARQAPVLLKLKSGGRQTGMWPTEVYTLWWGREDISEKWGQPWDWKHKHCGRREGARF